MMNSPTSLQQYNTYFAESNADGYSLQQLSLADLPIESGRIVLGDPMGAVIQMPFGQTLPTGVFPLEACIATNTYEGESISRLALLRWKFSSKTAEKWHLAVAEDVASEDIESLAPNEFIGAEFPYGIAVIGDLHGYEQHLLEVQTYIVENETGNYASEVIAPALAASEYGFGAIFHQEVLPVAIVTTGLGDGLFPAYWGVSEDGEIIELIVDFFVIGSYEE